MPKKSKFALFVLLFGGIILLITLLLINRGNIAVLNPHGQIASKERRLIITSTLLMLIVVVPVYLMTFGIAWKYRESNKKAKYSPDFDGHRLIESTWWAIPGVIILILASIAWRASHELDPFKSLSSTTPPMTIQAVSLQWKWLFIYPKQNIATVNTVEFPANTPINFEITSDAPMNSFWIPELSGQIYAMSGMATHLHMMADRTGSYVGSSANISGKGFAGMKFTAKSTTKADFEDWVELVRQTKSSLSFDNYQQLAKPSQNVPPTYYSSTQADLFDRIIMKYMSPTGEPALGHQHSEPH